MSEPLYITRSYMHIQLHASDADDDKPALYGRQRLRYDPGK